MKTESPCILFDARSVGTKRMSGWERYATGLLNELQRDVDLDRFVGMNANRSTQLASDWGNFPVTQRRYRCTIMPTFPPSLLCDFRRIVFFIHDLTWLHYPNWSSRAGRLYYQPLARYAIGKVPFIVTVSRSVRSELINEGVAASKVLVAYPGLCHFPDPVKPRTDPDLEGHPFALAVGSIEPRKNLDLLARVWSETDVAAEARLVVAGRSAWGQLPPNVVHVDSPTDANLAWLYDNALALLQPSFYEGFGLPVAEAEMRGLPVACSEIPVFREIVGTNATFFDPFSTTSAYSAIRSAIEIGRASPSTSFRYTWSQSVRTLSPAIRALTEEYE